MENLSIIMKYSGDQSISLSKADVNFDAEMQKCDELSVQPFPGALINYSQSTEIIPKNHTAAAITFPFLIRAAQLCQQAACLIA